LRNLALDLNPYMKIYVHKWQRSEDQKADFDFFEESNLALQEFAEKFSEFILPEHEPYSFQDFIGLMGSLEVFYGEKWEFSQILNEYLPLIQKVKKTVAGGAEEAIHPGEWRSFLLLGARAYVQYTRYTYFIRIDPTSSQSIGTRFIVKAIEDLFSSFEQLVREKPELGSRRSGNRHGNQGKITREELYELATSLSQVWST